MGIIDSVRRLVSGTEKTYPYECRDCGHEFESTSHLVKNVDCPECGSGFTRENVF